MEHVQFHQAAYYAISMDSIDADQIADLTPINEVVETHEPVEHFRPVDVMTQKMAGREEQTPFGVVVVRKGVVKHGRKHTMFLFREGDLTLVGWGI